ncbi:hypothetical protein B0H10DRAFT_1777090 [Mycena sp. CBHHK59/15]|nr:hypothetical protein B0H10DRAFT_1777090 [Mycena sp. CBHHK59/15]
MPVFPVELLDAVFLFLDAPDLAALASTNKAIEPIALRLLYRDVAVSPARLHRPTTRRAPLSLVLTLANRPDVAQYVRSFTLAVDHSTTLFHSFYRHLAAALSSMTALISLELFTDAEGWVLPDNPVYPQLQRFASSLPFDSRVAKFLGNAPALQTLQVEPAVHPPPSLPPVYVPCLTEFVGSSCMAAAIIPGHPVETIHITSGDLTEDLVPLLAESTVLVTVLSVTTSSEPVPLLQVLGHHLPHIMYLRITSTCNLSATPTTIFYEQVARVLSLFPNLQSFELSGVYWSSSQKPEDHQRVWQSQPFNSDFGSPDEMFDLYSESDLFFPY